MVRQLKHNVDLDLHKLTKGDKSRINMLYITMFPLITYQDMNRMSNVITKNNYLRTANAKCLDSEHSSQITEAEERRHIHDFKTTNP